MEAITAARPQLARLRYGIAVTILALLFSPACAWAGNFLGLTLKPISTGLFLNFNLFVGIFIISAAIGFGLLFRKKFRIRDAVSKGVIKEEWRYGILIISAVILLIGSVFIVAGIFDLSQYFWFNDWFCRFRRTVYAAGSIAVLDQFLKFLAQKYPLYAEGYTKLGFHKADEFYKGASAKETFLIPNRLSFLFVLHGTKRFKQNFSGVIELMFGVTFSVFVIPGMPAFAHIYFFSTIVGLLTGSIFSGAIDIARLGAGINTFAYYSKKPCSYFNLGDVILFPVERSISLIVDHFGDSSKEN